MYYYVLVRTSIINIYLLQGEMKYSLSLKLEQKEWKLNSHGLKTEERWKCNMNEFAIEWIKGRDYAGVSVPSGTAWKSKLMRYVKERPEDVKLMAENADGSAFFHVPVNYIKCSPPRQISEEQKEAAKQRFQEMREKKKLEEMENKTIEERTTFRECPFDDGEGTCHADKETECPVINCNAKYDIHGNWLKQ